MILSEDLRKNEKFSYQNQMILSCDLRKNEKFDFDSIIFKSESNDFVV